MRLTFALTLLLVGIHLVVPAQEQVTPMRIYQTKRIESKPPQIDGLIDEKVWETVEWSGNFTQYEPDDGAQPSQQTQFKILYDDNFLYIAVRAFDKDPDKIVKRMSRRDGFDGDWVEINIDSYFDKQTAFSFTASVSGVKGDEAVTSDGDNWDSTWDPIWYLRTSIDNQGWVAEMAIPFTQLRFDNADEQTWGLQVMRRVYRENERSLWQYISKKEAGWVNHFGELQGLKGIQPKRQVEIAPYALTKLESYEKEPGNPYADGTDLGYSAGVDGKIGITNDFTLNFTINPDFGQVEADPSEVNLTAFETYFQEKRPFFIEGRNITNFQISAGGNSFAQDNLFYSRRIGRYPQYDDFPDSAYVKMPEHTNILGALKITGKTQKGLSVGVLESFTSVEKAKIELNGVKSSETVEPATNYFISRVQKDLNNNNTLIGGMFTSTHRLIKSSQLNFLNSDAYTGGIDFTQYWKDKKYYLNVNFATSLIQGDVTAIRDQQESSRRYFQRPDNNYTRYDTTLTSLMGHGGNIHIGRQGSSGWRYLFWATWRSPGLELNDAGYLHHADAIFQVCWAGYRFANPISVFRDFRINFNQWTGWDFGGNMTFSGENTNFYAQFNNFWTISGGLNFDSRGISNNMLRGGPAMKYPGDWNTWWNFSSDSRKQLAISGFVSYLKGFDNYLENKDFGLEMQYRPNDALSFTLTPGYSIYQTQLQYLNTENYNGEDKYVFASINQRTTTLTARIDWIISPELTIQYYGSPFISAVDYYDPKQIINPKANRFSDRFSYDMSFSTEDYEHGYDFNFREYRSNLVARWEYRPNSLLYLVWTQNSNSEASTGQFSFHDDFGGLIHTHPYNVFLIKLSYLFF